LYLTLLPGTGRPLRRNEVTVTLPRAPGGCTPAARGPGAVGLAAAKGLMTAWTYTQAVMVMTVERSYTADAVGGSGLAVVTAAAGA
jgi:hypothetical protein